MWSDAGNKPVLKGTKKKGLSVISAHHTDPLFQESLADYDLYCEGDASLMFTENESNNERKCSAKNALPYVKDAFHTFLVQDKKEGERPRGYQSGRPLHAECGGGKDGGCASAPGAAGRNAGETI